MKTAKEYLGIINHAIDDMQLPLEPARLYQPMLYALTGGGKRLRPVLLLASAEASGGTIESALPAAMAVEMFHNFTLVHDDMMDRSALRRGRPSVYKKWNESTAILSGDAMLTYSNILLNRSDCSNLFALNELFNNTAIKVYEGQQLDMDFEERDDVTADEYMKMIGLKTAVLVAASASLGCLIAGDQKAADAMYKYGYNLGLAFQLQDDYLDTFGSQAQFGKPIGGDIVNRKKTWLLINAMNEAPEEVEKIYNESETPEKLVNGIKSLYVDHGLDDQCNILIGCFTSMAERALNSTGFDSKKIEFFHSFANSLIKRNK